MKIHLNYLLVRTRQTTERVDLSSDVTFIHGPIGKGKSTVARLVNYCFGGNIERTPAIQQEFVSVELSANLGGYDCTFERASNDNQSVRVTWSGSNDNIGSVNAPFDSQDEPLIDADVFNLSDLIFYLCDVIPIKVRKKTSDPDSPMIRLSFRDIWRYCYLDQTHLDSSFFRFEDPFRGRKSQDAMRFFTGLHSELLSQFEVELMRKNDEQRSKREAVEQIRAFIARFELDTDQDLESQLSSAKQELNDAKARLAELEKNRMVQTHPTDTLRDELRKLGEEIRIQNQAIIESKEMLSEQRALRAELITAKTKAERTDQALRILEGVNYKRCPECGVDVSHRTSVHHCKLCGSDTEDDPGESALELEVFRRDLNERIDQIADSINRRKSELWRTERKLKVAVSRKEEQDRQLQEELARYDSAYIESIRGAEREIATLSERINSLEKLQLMPQAVNSLEEEAGALQGSIDRLRNSVIQEREKLRAADANIALIADEFKNIMLEVSFPGVEDEDDIIIDPRNWRPIVVHGEIEWSYWDTGSGGKKTLFNVCYALALHTVALNQGLPVPTILVIDSPTKNISEDENPELVHSLYNEIYQLAESQKEKGLQLLLIDSELVAPGSGFDDFSELRMAGEDEAPALIPYYNGP